MSMRIEKKDTSLAEEYYIEAREKMMQKEYYDSISLIQNAIWILEDSDEYELYRKSLVLLGVAYSTIGNFSMSDDVYLKGISWCKQKEKPEFLYEFYNNIGSSFLNFGETETALSYFENAEDSNRLRKDSNPEDYVLWSFLIHLNKMISYLELERYLEAECIEQELGRSQNQSMIPDYMKFSYRIARAELFARTGRTQESETLSETLFDENELFSIYNYYENLGRLCLVFKNLKRLDLWKHTLELSEKYVENEKSVHLELTIVEKWMEYYEYVGDEENLNKECIRCAKLSVSQQRLWEKEHIQFLNKKIEFQISRKQYLQNEKKIYIDYLTHAGNREALERDFDSWHRENEDMHFFCIGMIDIDNFKKWNDTYGHLKGDACLQKVAENLMQNIAGCGKVYRFGGDEFLVLMSVSDKEQIEKFAKSVCNCCGKGEETITLSQGYCCWKNEQQISLQEGIARADEQLYAVKKAGRDNYKLKEY